MEQERGIQLGLGKKITAGILVIQTGSLGRLVDKFHI